MIATYYMLFLIFAIELDVDKSIPILWKFQMMISVLQYFSFQTACLLITFTGIIFVFINILLLQSVHDAVVASVTQALELGYRHFDTAAIYDTEGPLGHAIQEAILQGIINREDVFITTKVF